MFVGPSEMWRLGPLADSTDTGTKVFYVTTLKNEDVTT